MFVLGRLLKSRKPGSDFNGLNHEDALRQSQLHRCGFSTPCSRATEALFSRLFWLTSEFV